MKNLPLIYAVLFGAYIGISLPLPLMGPLILSSTSPFLLGEDQKFFYLSLVLAAFPLGNLLGAPLLGSLSDRFGKKRILLIGLFIGGICYALTGVAIAYGNMALLVFSRFFGGLGEGNAAIGQSYIAQGADDGKKAKHFGIMIAVMSVGYIAGPLLGALATDKTLIPFASMALPFYLVAIFIVLTMALVAIRFDRDPVVITNKIRFAHDIKHILQQNTLRHLIMLAICMAMGRSLYIDFLASFLKLRFTLASDAGTWLWVLLAAVWGIAALFTDSGSKYLSHHVKIVMATGLASISVLLIALCPTFSGMVFLSVFMVIGCALAGSLNAVLVSDAAPKSHMGLTMGLLGSTYLLGEVTACFVGGALLSLHEAAPFLISSAFFFFAALAFFTLFLRPRSKRKSDSLITAAP